MSLEHSPAREHRAPSHRDFGLYDEDEAAVALKKKKSTLRTWRARGEGPRVTYIGRTPFFSEEAIRDYLAAREVGREDEGDDS
jgi:hypothetical protein